MKKLVVVLMGGISGERKISFLTGKACSRALKNKGYKVINIDAKGKFVKKLKKIKPKVVFNALHGKYGEDGFVQSILESLKISYTHSGVYSSSIAMDKVFKYEEFFLSLNKYIVIRTIKKGIIFSIL